MPRRKKQAEVYGPGTKDDMRMGEALDRVLHLADLHGTGDVDLDETARNHMAIKLVKALRVGTFSGGGKEPKNVDS